MIRLVTILLVLAGICFGHQVNATPLAVELSSHFVAINSGFRGADVVVFGTAEDNSDVIVELRGPPGLATIRRKERILGIWVNAKSIRFRDAPSFYAVASSRPITAILAPEKRNSFQIGTDALSVLSLDDDDAADQARFRTALIDDRARAGLYHSGFGDISFQGEGLYRTQFYVPSNVPIGLYHVRALLVRGGEVVEQRETPLYVGKVGASADIYNFAHQQSFYYAICAIMIAAGAGWLASWLFRRK